MAAKAVASADVAAWGTGGVSGRPLPWTRPQDDRNRVAVEECRCGHGHGGWKGKRGPSLRMKTRDIHGGSRLEGLRRAGWPVAGEAVGCHYGPGLVTGVEDVASVEVAMQMAASDVAASLRTRPSE